MAVLEGKELLLVCGRAPECDFSRKLFKYDRIPTERSCPTCGRPNMILRLGAYGPFLGCAGFASHVCKRTIILPGRLHLFCTCRGARTGGFHHVRYKNVYKIRDSVNNQD